MCSVAHSWLLPNSAMKVCSPPPALLSYFMLFWLSLPGSTCSPWECVPSANHECKLICYHFSSGISGCVIVIWKVHFWDTICSLTALSAIFHSECAVKSRLKVESWMPVNWSSSEWRPLDLLTVNIDNCLEKYIAAFEQRPPALDWATSIVCMSLEVLEVYRWRSAWLEWAN